LQKEEETKSEEGLKNCKVCKDPKFTRSHHCQICGYCVFKMDHHCPWINNCVGLHNHRYFILFLTHTFFGCVFVCLTAAPIVFETTIKKSQEFTFVTVLCCVGTLLLLFFNGWNWLLIIKGNTTIEYWMLKTGISHSIIKDFGFESWKENLFVVFGTRSLFEAIMLPSIKRLPLSGLEWTKLEHKNFEYEFGELKKDETTCALKDNIDLENNNTS